MAVLPRVAKAAERGQVPVADPCTAQRLCKCAGIELRLEARPWQRPYIDYKRNARRREERKESFDSPVGMTDGVKICQSWFPAIVLPAILKQALAD